MRRATSYSLMMLLVMVFIWQPPTTVSAADEYPNKQINWYIHASAGGGTDIFSRTAAIRLRKILGVPIVISSMSGGSGARMLNHLMERPADGYTIVSLTTSNMATMAREMTTASREDLIGIARGCYDPQAVVISSKGKYKDINDIITAAKEKPGKIKVAITNVASVDHVAVYALGKAAGVKFEFVPFKSGGEIIVALLGGVVDMGALNPSEFMGQYEAGNVKPAVMLSGKRLEQFPDTPTALELGYDVEMANWRGVAVKKGTPEQIVKKLQDAFQQSMSSSVYQNYLKDNSMGPESILTGEEWNEFLDKMWPTWKETMTELGYKK